MLGTGSVKIDYTLGQESLQLGSIERWVSAAVLLLAFLFVCLLTKQSQYSSYGLES